jgi:hypothetical protein
MSRNVFPVVPIVIIAAALTAACGGDNPAAVAAAADTNAETPVIDVAVVRATESALTRGG